MVARTETLGGTCCVRWWKTGHRIDGGRMFRDVRVSLEISFPNPESKAARGVKRHPNDWQGSCP
jgi:hypothetical protein